MDTAKKESVSSIRIKIDQDPYDFGYDLYMKSSLTIKPGLTVLVGCNGSGKTTILNMIRDQFRKRTDKFKHFLFFEYDNVHEGGSNAISAAGFYGNMDLAASLITSSEGENIKTNLGEFVAGIGRKIHNHPGAEGLIIVLDASDSGFSIDNIIDHIDFFQFLYEQNPNMVIYIIAAANSFEFARGEDCVEMFTLHHHQFKTYESYKKFILWSRQYKDSCYEEWKKKQEQRKMRSHRPKKREAPKETVVDEEPIAINVSSDLSVKEKAYDDTDIG